MGACIDKTEAEIQQKLCELTEAMEQSFIGDENLLIPYDGANYKTIKGIITENNTLIEGYIQDAENSKNEASQSAIDAQTAVDNAQTIQAQRLRNQEIVFVSDVNNMGVEIEVKEKDVLKVYPADGTSPAIYSMHSDIALSTITQLVAIADDLADDRVTLDVSNVNTKKVTFLRTAQSPETITLKIRGDVGKYIIVNDVPYRGIGDSDITINSGDDKIIIQEYKKGCVSKIYLSNSRVSVSTAELANFSEIKMLEMYKTDTFGDLTELKGLKHMEEIILGNTLIVGDISLFSNFPNLKIGMAHNTSAGGELSSLSLLSSLSRIYLSGTLVSVSQESTIKVTSRLFLYNCNLTEEEVDNALKSLLNGNTTNATIKIGGNNAVPSATGLGYVDDLRDAGNTVEVTT